MRIGGAPVLDGEYGAIVTHKEGLVHNQVTSWGMDR
jgi:hypothetical protein